jgi:hypothetical protein
MACAILARTIKPITAKIFISAESDCLIISSWGKDLDAKRLSKTGAMFPPSAKLLILQGE